MNITTNGKHWSSSSVKQIKVTGLSGNIISYYHWILGQIINKIRQFYEQFLPVKKTPFIWKYIYDLYDLTAWILRALLFPSENSKTSTMWGVNNKQRRPIIYCSWPKGWETQQENIWKKNSHRTLVADMSIMIEIKFSKISQTIGIRRSRE